MFVQGQVRVKRESARVLQPLAFIVKADLAAVMGERADLACRTKVVVQPDFQGVVLLAHIDFSPLEADEDLTVSARLAVRRFGAGGGSSAKSCNLRPTLSSAAS